MKTIQMLRCRISFPMPEMHAKIKSISKKWQPALKSLAWKQPIVVDKNNVIVVGHTRYEAAQSLHQTEVPVLIADDLNEQQIKAYRLMDNRSAQDAEWDIAC